jgi:hypothetical protein
MTDPPPWEHSFNKSLTLDPHLCFWGSWPCPNAQSDRHEPASDPVTVLKQLSTKLTLTWLYSCSLWKVDPPSGSKNSMLTQVFLESWWQSFCVHKTNQKNPLFN